VSAVHLRRRPAHGLEELRIQVLGAEDLFGLGRQHHGHHPEPDGVRPDRGEELSQGDGGFFAPPLVRHDGREAGPHHVAGLGAAAHGRQALVEGRGVPFDERALGVGRQGPVTGHVLLVG